MTPTRLRPAHPPERLAEIYARPHQHTLWADHKDRVNATIALALSFAPFSSAADLSCGDAAILLALKPGAPWVLGDIAPGWPITGPIEQTLDDCPPVDVFILTETIEHLDDPFSVLRRVRQKCDVLILSTPIDAYTDRNEEHYWAWSKADVDDMLFSAGFVISEYSEVDWSVHGPDFYRFGIWGCL